MHELRNLIGISDNYSVVETRAEEQMYQSVRADVMDKIEPVAAFNAWNLSIICNPPVINVPMQG